MRRNITRKRSSNNLAKRGCRESIANAYSSSARAPITSKRPSPSARVEIQHTLLGVELKLGRKRLLCPDLATARYLSVFARLGCQDVALPYDITKISQLADELESSWYRMLLLAEQEADRGKHKVQGKTSWPATC